MRAVLWTMLGVLVALGGEPTVTRSFPASTVSPKSGTIAVAVRSDGLPAETVVPLASMGQNDPVWWLLAVKGREVSWLMENHGAVQLPGTYYVRLDATRAADGEVLEVAVTWQRQASGVVKVVLYVDGKAVAERADVKLAPSLGKAATIGIGWNTADAKAFRLSDGQVVASLVSGRALSAAEITANHRKLLAGETWTDKETTDAEH